MSVPTSVSHRMDRQREVDDVALNQPLDKSRVDVLVDDQPRGRATRLSLEREVHAGDDPRDGLIEIGIGEDDDRVLAAELERDGLHGDFGCASLNPSSRTLATDEREPTDQRMSDECVACLCAEAGYDVHRRRAGRCARTHPQERRVATDVCSDGLRTRVLPAARGARDLHRRKQNGMIERHDTTDDAEWLAQRVVDPTVAGRNRLALRLRSQTGEVSEPGSPKVDVSKQVPIRTSVVSQCQLAPAPRVGSPVPLRAHEEAPLAPWALRAPRRESRLCRIHRRVNIGGTAPGHAGDDFAGRGIDRIQVAPSRADRRLPADENLQFSDRRYRVHCVVTP